MDHIYQKCIAISYTGIYGSQIYGSYKLPYMCHIYFDIFETANFIHFEIYDNIFVRDIYSHIFIYVIYIYGHILDLCMGKPVSDHRATTWR